MATTSVQQEHLEAAWRALRQPAWPATLAETMLDRARAALVLGYACTLARRRPAQRFPAPPARVPRPGRIAAHQATHAQSWVDCKRAAAGDRDD